MLVRGTETLAYNFLWANSGCVGRYIGHNCLPYNGSMVSILECMDEFNFYIVITNHDGINTTGFLMGLAKSQFTVDEFFQIPNLNRTGFAFWIIMAISSLLLALIWDFVLGDTIISIDLAILFLFLPLSA